MTVRRSPTVVAWVLAGASCGDDDAVDGGGLSSDSGGPSSTSESSGCSRVIDGDLDVLENTALEDLQDIGQVTGTLTIGMGTRAQADLSFLACLHTVDLAVRVLNNRALESTGGLTNLEFTRGVIIQSNTALKRVEGFEQLRETATLQIDGNASLEVIDLHVLESVTRMSIGTCNGDGQIVADNGELQHLDGFSQLADLGSLSIQGQESLVSVEVLQALASNGAPALDDATIKFNPNLSEDTVNGLLDMVGVTGMRTVCGNSGGGETCGCAID